MNQRLIVVSNRLPVVVTQNKNGGWSISPGEGGLVTALEPLMRKNRGVWIGWPGCSNDVPIADLMDQFAVQQGYSLKTVSYEQWKRDLITFAETNPGRGWNVYLPLIADVDAQVLHMPRFGQENTKAGLKGSSIKSKPLDRKLLDSYFK